ncbi:MAG TPA: AI-2E family transporter [Chthoniobacteraceae bacterium]|jgi:predicted PurR-regulated permease PerM|nr:AI-2E family transporter [Chthoniobacteraceae bacterium]
MEPTPIPGRDFRAAFVLVLVVGISVLFLAVAWPFLQSLLIGAILAGLCRPLYRWLVKLLRGRKSLASALTLLILFVLIAGPLSAFLSVVIRQALHVSTQAVPWLREHFGAGSGFNAHDSLVQRFPSLAEYIPAQDELVDNVGVAAKSAGAFLVAAGSRVTAGTAVFLLDLFVMMYATFFFLRDGPAILEKIFYYMPLSDEDEERMLHRFVSVTRATVKGTLIIGLIQGTLAGLAFWPAGIDGAAFWGTIMVILSIVPGIGAALVWVPAAIYLFLTGHTMAGLLLTLWCAGVVGTIDNVLRPMLVGKDAKMPDLLILVGTLGGLFLFGPIGFVVGPVVCGLFLTAWDIYGAAFKDVLPPVKGLRAEIGEAPLIKKEPARAKPTGA